MRLCSVAWSHGKFIKLVVELTRESKVACSIFLAHHDCSGASRGWGPQLQAIPSVILSNETVNVLEFPALLCSLFQLPFVVSGSNTMRFAVGVEMGWLAVFCFWLNGKSKLKTFVLRLPWLSLPYS